jgi:hypothetical protein
MRLRSCRYETRIGRRSLSLPPACPAPGRSSPGLQADLRGGFGKTDRRGGSRKDACPARRPRHGRPRPYLLAAHHPVHHDGGGLRRNGRSNHRSQLAQRPWSALLRRGRHHSPRHNQGAVPPDAAKPACRPLPSQTPPRNPDPPWALHGIPRQPRRRDPAHHLQRLPGRLLWLLEREVPCLT